MLVKQRGYTALAALERRATAQHLVKDDAEAVHVGEMRGRLAPQQFRRNVYGRTGGVYIFVRQVDSIGEAWPAQNR